MWYSIWLCLHMQILRIQLLVDQDELNLDTSLNISWKTSLAKYLFFLAVCASFNEWLSERPCLNIEFFTRDLMTSVHLGSSRLVTELFIFVNIDGFVSFHLGWQHPGLTIWCLFFFFFLLYLCYFFSSLKKYKYFFCSFRSTYDKKSTN